MVLNQWRKDREQQEMLRALQILALQKLLGKKISYTYADEKMIFGGKKSQEPAPSHSLTVIEPNDSTQNAPNSNASAI
jgi:hypothetical protein